MERIQSPQLAAADVAEERIPAERDPARLPGLISSAQATGIQSERHLLAREINSLLIAMRAPGNEAAEAKAVLAALDLEALEGLVDDEGKSCRAEAVETLLACGFPHALNVRPEDLAFRDEHAMRRRENRWMPVRLGVVGAAFVFGVLTALGGLKSALGVMALGVPLVGLLIFIVVANSQAADKPKP